jgi:hypothetical protein
MISSGNIKSTPSLQVFDNMWSFKFFWLAPFLKCLLHLGQLNPPEVELLLAAASVHESAVIVPPERDGVGAKAEGKVTY